MSKGIGDAASAAEGVATGGLSVLSGGAGFSQNLGGGLSSLLGQSNVASTEGQIADAQLGQQQSDRSTATGYAAPTQQEIQALQQEIATNGQSITQAQSLINSTDPAIQAAAAQALNILNGGSSQALAPIQNQRAQGRQQLQQQLEAQLGPGYATSSAGIQALNNYDQGTANAMTQAQQSTLGTLLGTTQYGAGLGITQQQQGINNYGSIQKTIGQQQQLQINALTGTPVNPGLQYAGQLAQGQANSANLGALLGMGSQQLPNGNFSQMFGSGTSAAPANAYSMGTVSTAGGAADAVGGAGAALVG